jgi:predicted rRNA methylase YqxC with S4 and FtsJ domains
MESQLSLHLKAFNKRVQVMNQTNARDLTLTKIEAQNLHNDIFDLLTQIAELAKIKDAEATEVINVGMDGGGF